MSSDRIVIESDDGRFTFLFNGNWFYYDTEDEAEEALGEMEKGE